MLDYSVRGKRKSGNNNSLVEERPQEDCSVEDAYTMVPYLKCLRFLVLTRNKSRMIRAHISILSCLYTRARIGIYRTTTSDRSQTLEMGSYLEHLKASQFRTRRSRQTEKTKSRKTQASP